MIDKSIPIVYIIELIIVLYILSCCRMFIMENGNQTADPCFVGQSITWQTRSNGQFLESHQATKKLYENQIKCNSSSPAPIGHSTHSGGYYNNSVIHFQLIDPLEYETWSRNVSLVYPLNKEQTVVKA